jgi:hypothetical protein
MIEGNVSRRDQSHMNIRYEILDWFGRSRGVIVLRQVLMYYAIKIGSSLFLSESSRVFPRMFSGSFWACFLDCPRDVTGMFFLLLNVDLSSLFIVGESSHRV